MEMGEYLKDMPDPDFSFPCAHCPATFLSLRQLRKHTTNEHTPPSDFSGINSLGTLNECQDETRAVSTKYKQASKIFTKSTSEVVDYNNESKPSTNEFRPKYPCDICGAVKWNLTNHMKTHQKERLRKCNFGGCEKEFVKKTLLDQHRSTEHGIKKDGIKKACPFCPYVASPSVLRRHMPKHTGEKDFTCTECGKGFTTKAGWELHIKGHSGVRSFECKSCDKRYISIGQLNAHKMVKHESNQFICTECGRIFQAKGELTRHTTLHTGEKKYKCRFCDMNFRLPFTRQKHELIHKGIKKYKCHLCPKEFTGWDGLNVHVKRHLNQKDHVCARCNTGFIEPAGLRRHNCAVRK
jgi:KRAB domain-containing zinc finger protein